MIDCVWQNGVNVVYTNHDTGSRVRKHWYEVEANDDKDHPRKLLTVVST